MTLNVEETNNERELLNFEPSHLYNMARHKGVTLNPVENTGDLNTEAEYGVWIFKEDGTRRTVLKFASLARAQAATSRFPGSMVVRLGRNHRWRNADVVHVQRKTNEPIGSFLAKTDESGNIEIPEHLESVNLSAYQLISNELTMMGYYQGDRPSAEVLRNLAMRYNDIVPDDFAAAVIKHCEIPRIREEGDQNHKASSFKSLEEKEAWYDTPAGKAWVQEHPIPSIFNLPTPEYIHRRG